MSIRHLILKKFIEVDSGSRYLEFQYMVIIVIKILHLRRVRKAVNHPYLVYVTALVMLAVIHNSELFDFKKRFGQIKSQLIDKG